MMKSFIMAMTVSIALPLFAQQQLDLFITEAQTKAEIAGFLAPDRILTQTRQDFPSLRGQELRVAIGENFLKSGGSYAATGEALVSALQNSIYFESQFDVMKYSTIFADAERGLKLSTTNVIRNRHALVILEVFSDAVSGMTVETARKMAQTEISRMGIPAAVDFETLSETSFETRGKGIHSLRVDVYIAVDASINSMAKKFEFVLDRLGSAARAEKLQKLSSDRTTDRAVRAAQERSGAKVDVKEAVARGARK
jgi:hypothetical protein